MKKLLFVLMLMLIPSICLAGPFLVSDPLSEITLFKLTGPSWVPASVPANLDGSLYFDVAASVVGENSLTVSACLGDSLWGEICYDPVPFVFTRPSLTQPSGPMNLRLQVR